MERSLEFTVVDIVDQEDGSAVLTFDADKDTMRMLAGQGLLRILEKAIEDYAEVNEVLDKEEEVDSE